ncbi:hypothetical protein AC578_1623 [Pseudocercospora eumusae]|uniref:Uncharacterized protein n=1 Tax=Pseudocercospora eumusae TaxID=321146 RepID=A0A139HM52_9PEZI|nr:hypothetical protein AC578_1623 [Pseudocercospora eumusae]
MTTKTSGLKRNHEDDEDGEGPASKRLAHHGHDSFSSFGNLWSKPATFSLFVGPKALGHGRATGSLPSGLPRKPFGGNIGCFAKKEIFGVTSPLSMAGAAPVCAPATSSLPDPSNRFCSPGVTTAIYRGPNAANLSDTSESQSPRERGGRAAHSWKSAPKELAVRQDSTEAVTSKLATSRPVFGKRSPS